MKIPGGIPRVTEVYDKHKSVKKAGKSSNVTSKKDVVSISNQAKDFQTVMKALKNVPDMRKEKVEKLAKEFEEGKYQVKEMDIADRILKSISEKKE
ncbi:UNVERIFIED_CONTAM: FlgM family anti-sigma-28 factor [Acetivibrio alkalicellulosi]